MIYNASNPVQKLNAQERFNKLIQGGKRFELTEKKGGKTRGQNRYLHLILGWFAVEYGDTMDYVKQELFKKAVNREIFKTEFINEKSGEIREAWKSWSIISSSDAALAITRFRNWSNKEADIYLPEPDETNLLDTIEAELSKHSNKEFI